MSAALYEFETPAERGHRVVAEWARDVLAPQITDCPDPRVPFTQVEAGDSIRHASDYWTVSLISHKGGWMVVTNDGRTERIDDIDPGELFLLGGF